MEYRTSAKLKLGGSSAVEALDHQLDQVLLQQA